MGKESKQDISFTQNRELSWLEFNKRVLQEALDEQIPLLERYKFISIFTSNLDEFFMVRVGSLLALASMKRSDKVIDPRSGLTPMEQLEAIYRKIPALYSLKDRLTRSVEGYLREENIVRLSYQELTKEEKEYTYRYFYRHIYPSLTPVMIDMRHPFIHVENNHLCVVAHLSSPRIDRAYGMVSLPKNISRLIFLPGQTGRFILMEEVISTFMKEIFEGFTIQEKSVICVTRSADMNLDEEVHQKDKENLRTLFKKALRKRTRLAPVRLEIQGELSKASRKFLQKELNLSKSQVYVSGSPLKMDYVFALEGRLSKEEKEKLCYPPYQPIWQSGIDRQESILEQIQRQDIFLHFPFDSMEPFLKMLKEAADDERVINIKITIYRLASISKVAEYLARAAENGKDVTVLMELRARFDEHNNIDWSERLEQAGCRVIYGLEDYKVHSKVCLITLKEGDEIRHITQIGTGNYNEKTSKQYTDFSLMTSRKQVGLEAVDFFKNILMNEVKGNAGECLVSSPYAIKEMIIKMLDREITRTKEGKEGYAFLKCNSITEREIIDKLSQASCEGVKIDLVVRGICCILPGVVGKTENIRIYSLVGRFLEHHRLYIFGKRQLEEEVMYITSADLMTRNLQRRIELALLVEDDKIKNQLHKIVDIYMADGSKMKELQSDGSYTSIGDRDGMNAQQACIQLSYKKEEALQQEKEKEREKEELEKEKQLQESHQQSLERQGEASKKKGGLFGWLARVFGR